MTDIQLSVSFTELCEACGTEQQVLIEMVEFGVIEVEPPQHSEPEHWQFPTATIERAQKALRLHHDLAVNLEGVALALDLLDEIDHLKSRIEQLETR